MKISLAVSTVGMTKRLKDHSATVAEIRSAAVEWERALFAAGYRSERTVKVKVEFGVITENADSAARTYRTPHARVPDGFDSLIVISNEKGMSLCHKGTNRIARFFFGSIELFTLALHEIGHAIGLPHNEDPGQGMDSIMDAAAPFSCFKGLSSYDGRWATEKLSKQ